MSEHKWHEELHNLWEGNSLLDLEHNIELTGEIIKIRENFPSVMPNNGVEMCHYYWLNNIENTIINIGKLSYEKPVFKCGDIPPHVKIEVDRIMKVLNLWVEHITIDEIREKYSFVYDFASKIYGLLGEYNHFKAKLVKLLIKFLHISYDNNKSWKWLDENAERNLIGIPKKEIEHYVLILKKGASFWCNFNFLYQLNKVLAYIGGDKNHEFLACRESLKYIKQFYPNAYLGTIALRSSLKLWLKRTNRDAIDKKIALIATFVYDFLGEPNDEKRWLVASLVAVLDYWLRQYNIFKG